MVNILAVKGVTICVNRCRILTIYV